MCSTKSPTLLKHLVRKRKTNRFRKHSRSMRGSSTSDLAHRLWRILVCQASCGLYNRLRRGWSRITRRIRMSTSPRSSSNWVTQSSLQSSPSQTKRPNRSKISNHQGWLIKSLSRKHFKSNLLASLNKYKNGKNWKSNDMKSTKRRFRLFRLNLRSTTVWELLKWILILRTI